MRYLDKLEDWFIGLKMMKLKTEERKRFEDYLRRNGVLAYRPTLKGFGKAADQAWAENLPEDSQDSDEQQEEEEHEQEEEQHEEEQQEEEEQHTRRSSMRRRSMSRSRRRRRRRRMRRGSRRRTTRRGTSMMTRTYRTMYDFSISSGL